MPGTKYFIAYGEFSASWRRESIVEKRPPPFLKYPPDFVRQLADQSNAGGLKKSSVPGRMNNFNRSVTFYLKYGDFIGRIFTFLSGLFILISITSAITNRKKLKLKK